MCAAMIHQVISMLTKSFEALRVPMPSHEVEDLAVTIHKVMDVEVRLYHSLEHVFTLWQLPNPTQSLAAPFHDLVYYQVDQGIPPAIHAVISPHIREKREKIFIAETIDPRDRPFLITLEVFGFQVGQELSPTAGLNEFLSALFMNIKLFGVVPERDLLQTTACIEATIPFRGENERGESCMDLLESRLHQVNQRHGLSMTPSAIEDAVKAATVFGNQDVASFAEEDVAIFLGDTWKLLPESNVALRSGRIYSIREFRQALWETELFLSTLDPKNIFHHYKGVPPEEEFRHLVQQGQQNVATAREYLGIKLLAIAILEALAEISGGDAPVSLFMGTAEGDRQSRGRIEDFLPDRGTSDAADQSPTIIRLLESGRASESAFDIRNSPLSLFLYQTMGGRQIQQVQDDIHALFEEKVGARTFLDRLDGSAVAAIATACAAMVPTRREALLQYARLRT